MPATSGVGHCPLQCTVRVAASAIGRCLVPASGRLGRFTSRCKVLMYQGHDGRPFTDGATDAFH